MWCSHKLKWPLFHSVVTDWSWAEINAILLSWNNLKVSEYLEKTYDAVNHQTPLDKAITPLFFCYAHLMKMISRYLKKKNVSKSGISFALEMMALVVHIYNYQLLKKTIENLFIVLIYPSKNKEFQDTMSQLLKVQSN